ncbi:MAG: AMP-dependent synthetase/ligase [Vibrio sp.]
MSLEQYHVISLLNQQCQTNPNQIALEGYEMQAPWQSLSWHDFDRITNAVSMHLIDSGLEVQDKCAILSNNCPQWTCADVAVLKARAVVVPIYPTSTTEQARYILSDAKAKVLFVEGEAQYHMACELERMCPEIEQVIVFNTDVELISPSHFYFDTIIANANTAGTNEALQSRLDKLQLDDLLTLIYTSGTTGDPKGVMLDYKNMAASIAQHDQVLDFNSGDVSLAFLPLSHVFERGWSFYVLCRGGKNVYLNDTNKLKDALVAVKPHVLCVVPRVLEKIYSAVKQKADKAGGMTSKIFAWSQTQGLKHFAKTQAQKSVGPWLGLQNALADKLVFSKVQAALGGRIKFIPCGGAALDTNVAKFFQAVDVPIICGYGMTETTATVSCHTVGNRVLGSNGQILPQTQIKLGDNDEILIKGDTVMRGYYNRDQDTKDSFTEDGWLKTGDAGALDENGNLFITDRIKELMKTSNGKYIAPQRVEGKVGCCPFIEQVAIVADARNYVTALIVPAFEQLEAWAKEKGIHAESPLELVKNSQVMAHFETRLKEIQAELAGFEKIKKFTLLPEAFSMESGLITPTLKLKRKNIYTKYSNEISAMYAG